MEGSELALWPRTDVIVPMNRVRVLQSRAVLGVAKAAHPRLTQLAVLRLA